MPSKSALSVSLTPELLELIASKVETGRYRSASEVVRAALRMFEQQDGVNADRYGTTVPVHGRRHAR
jgi:antitoxin ParD1/3/4